MTDRRTYAGWAAVAISTLAACFWAYWGSIETFPEGWFFHSFWKNVGLMFAQYLSPMMIFVLLALSSIRLPSVEEAVCSMIRHGKNAGGTWDSVSAKAEYAIEPD